MAQKQKCCVSDMGHMNPQIRSTTTTKTKTSKKKVQGIIETTTKRKKRNNRKHRTNHPRGNLERRITRASKPGIPAWALAWAWLGCDNNGY